MGKLALLRAWTPYTLIVSKVRGRGTAYYLALEAIEILTRPALRVDAFGKAFDESKWAIAFICHRVIDLPIGAFRNLIALERALKGTRRAFTSVNDWVPDFSICTSNFRWQACSIDIVFIARAFTGFELFVPDSPVRAWVRDTEIAVPY